MKIDTVHQMEADNVIITIEDVIDPDDLPTISDLCNEVYKELCNSQNDDPECYPVKTAIYICRNEVISVYPSKEIVRDLQDCIKNYNVNEDEPDAEWDMEAILAWDSMGLWWDGTGGAKAYEELLDQLEGNN